MAAVHSDVVLPRSTIFRLGKKSVLRSILLALCAFAASMRIAGFPHIETLHGSPWQGAAVGCAIWAIAEAARCLDRKRWSLYHAGVLILLYADMMILAMTIFLWIYL
jgi:hypothetical protein